MNGVSGEEMDPFPGGPCLPCLGVCQNYPILGFVVTTSDSEVDDAVALWKRYLGIILGSSSKVSVERKKKKCWLRFPCLIYLSHLEFLLHTCWIMAFILKFVNFTT